MKQLLTIEGAEGTYCAISSNLNTCYVPVAFLMLILVENGTDMLAAVLTQVKLMVRELQQSFGSNTRLRDVTPRFCLDCRSPFVC